MAMKDNKRKDDKKDMKGKKKKDCPQEPLMPLLPGKKNIGTNIKEMELAGHPYRQALAAALNKAYDSKNKINKKERQ